MIGLKQDTAIAMAGRTDGGMPVTSCIARNTRHEQLKSMERQLNMTAQRE